MRLEYSQTTKAANMSSDSGTVGDPKHGWLGDVMLKELVGAKAPVRARVFLISYTFHMVKLILISYTLRI